MCAREKAILCKVNKRQSTPAYEEKAFAIIPPFSLDTQGTPTSSALFGKPRSKRKIGDAAPPIFHNGLKRRFFLFKTPKTQDIAF